MMGITDMPTHIRFNEKMGTLPNGKVIMVRETEQTADIEIIININLYLELLSNITP